MADIDTAIKVDIGILKTQILTITQLCDKMDKVIEKLVDNHDRMVNQIYNDMQKREDDKDMDVKELHSRITTISRELSEKVELTEHKIMEEIKKLRLDFSEHYKKEDAELRKIMEWKWTVIGVIIVLVWLLSHIKYDTITKLLN